MNYHEVIDKSYYFKPAENKTNYQEDTIVINNLREAILLFDDFKYAKAEITLSDCIKYIEINGVRFKRVEENE